MLLRNLGLQLDTSSPDNPGRCRATKNATTGPVVLIETDDLLAGSTEVHNEMVDLFTGGTQVHTAKMHQMCETSKMGRFTTTEQKGGGVFAGSS